MAEGPAPAGAFWLTLPDKRRVLCWAKDLEAIFDDVRLTGNVYLVKDPGSEVYDRVAPDSVEAEFMEQGGARRVTE